MCVNVCVLPNNKCVYFQAVLLFNWVGYVRTTYGNDYTYPIYGEGIGWGMAAFCVIWIPVVAVILFFYTLCHPNKVLYGSLMPFPSYSYVPCALPPNKCILSLIFGCNDFWLYMYNCYPHRNLALE